MMARPTAGRRVVITGLGVVSALGVDIDELWRSLKGGHSGIGPIEATDCSDLKFRAGAEARRFSPESHFSKKTLGHLDRFAQFALVAAREAVQCSRIEWSDDSRRRAAVVTGSSMGGQATLDQAFFDLYSRKRPRLHPLTIPRIMANAGASHISMELGLSGPAFTISTACSSSSHAIGQAYWMVRQGHAETAICGGSEAPFSPGILKAWEALRVVAPETCRPFSKDRNGMILGEGGAMLFLEPLEVAQQRAATILGEIVGFGMSSDAHHITQPSPRGAKEAMRAALEDAGLQPRQVAYINAHGTGTLANDSSETRAIHKVFGSHAHRLAVSSTKSMHGHALGAAGAIEAVATVLALHHATLPPTINFTEPDPACDLDVIPHEARKSQAEFALSSSFAFGGLNAVLAFRRWQNGNSSLGSLSRGTRSRS